MCMRHSMQEIEMNDDCFQFLKIIFKEHLKQIRYNVKKHTFIIMMTDCLSNTEFKCQSVRLAC